MKTKLLLFFTLALIYGGCKYENEEEKYPLKDVIQITDTVKQNFNEQKSDTIAIFKFENNLLDSSDNHIKIQINSDSIFKTTTRSQKYSKNCLALNGSSYILFSVPKVDTFSVFFWFKGKAPLPTNANVTLIDYGKGALQSGIEKADIDGHTGGTYPSFQNKLESTNWINNTQAWNFIYILFDKNGKIIESSLYAWHETRTLYKYSGTYDAIKTAGENYQITIGGPSENPTGKCFNGYIDDLMIYKRKLSEVEIQAFILK
jgi:hypothetical protein